VTAQALCEDGCQASLTGAKKYAMGFYPIGIAVSCEAVGEYSWNAAYAGVQESSHSQRLSVQSARVTGACRMTVSIAGTVRFAKAKVGTRCPQEYALNAEDGGN